MLATLIILITWNIPHMPLEQKSDADNLPLNAEGLIISAYGSFQILVGGDRTYLGDGYLGPLLTLSPKRFSDIYFACGCDEVLLSTDISISLKCRHL